MSNDTPEARDQDAERLTASLDPLISDEALRIRVRRIVDQRPSDPAWERLTKHPLVTLLLGFGLTWGVGTLLTKKWEQAQLQTQLVLEQQRRVTEARIAVIDEFFAIPEEHSARAFQVERALDRGAPISELAELIHAKNELFAKTTARFGSIRFRLRHLLPPELYIRIAKAFNDGVYVPLQTIDQAQATAFEDRLERRRSPRYTPDEKREAAEAANTVASCNLALAEALWYSAIAPGEATSLEQRDRSLRAMDEKCGTEN